MSAGDRRAFQDDFIALGASGPPASPPPPDAPSLDQLIASLDADDRPPDSRKRKRDAGVLDLATPWSRDVDWPAARHAAQALHREVVAFDRYLAPTPGEHDTRRAAIQLIRQAVVSRFRDAEVHSFGSQETRLYLPQGDIDLVCVSDSVAAQNPRRVLHSLKTLIQTRGIADDVQVIAHARVPIIKFTTLPSLGKFKVDMSLNHTNGIAAARYVNTMLRRQPAVRPLTMCVKLLLAQRGLSEVYSGGLGSFACTLLVINFLQLHPKVQRREIDPCDNLGVLLLEFFLLYGKQFNYDNVGITVRGKGGYFSKARAGWKNEGRPFLLSIEDPLDTTNDVSKSSFNILSVRQTFSGAYDVLSSALCRFDPNQDPGRHLLQPKKTTFDDKGRRKPVEPSRDPRSLLGCIVGISEEAIKQRNRMSRLSESGYVHSKLDRPLEPEAARSPSARRKTISSRSSPELTANQRNQSRAQVKAAMGISDAPSAAPSPPEGREKAEPVYVGGSSSDEADVVTHVTPQLDKEERDHPKKLARLSRRQRTDFWASKSLQTPVNVSDESE